MSQSIDTQQRAQQGRRAGIFGIVCNLTLFAFKLLVGLLSGFMSIIADAVNNLSDASASIITLLGFRLAAKPADPEHPYGHGRYEYLAGLLVTMLILLIGFELLKSSVERIAHPQPQVVQPLTLIVLACSIVVKLGMMIHYRRVGNRINSQTLLVAAADSRNDVLTTTTVLLSVLLTRLFDLALDGWISLAVSLFILYSGFDLLKSTLDPLLGHAPSPELVEEIRTRILSYPGVLGTHDLMLHDYGVGRQFGSVHVEMAAESDPEVAHRTIDRIEHELLAEFGLQLVVHYDPVSTSADAEHNLRLWLTEELQLIHPDLSIHDLSVSDDNGCTVLRFDCVVPAGLELSEKELLTTVSVLVRHRFPNSRCEITIDHGYITHSH